MQDVIEILVVEKDPNHLTQAFDTPTESLEEQRNQMFDLSKLPSQRIPLPPGKDYKPLMLSPEEKKARLKRKMLV